MDSGLVGDRTFGFEPHTIYFVNNFDKFSLEL